MKNITAVANALRTDYSVSAVPKATIEWNLNRYFDLRVSNWVGDHIEEHDEDLFPIESIVQPWRPVKGINKARVGYSYVTGYYNDNNTARFYLASEKDKYKYWMSPYPSDLNGLMSNCLPAVVYDESIQANKIKVVVENTWASPTEYFVQYTTDGGFTWQNTVAAPIQNDGTIEVFWTGTEWSATQPENTAPTTTLNGVRFACIRIGGGILRNGLPTTTRVNGAVVTTMGQGAYFSLIELAACVIRDVSEFLISSSDSFNSGSVDVVSPVGTLTTNTGSITLWNEDNLFSTENTASPYHRLIEQNAEVNLSYVYDIDGTPTTVQQFKLYADEWSASSDGTISISLSDASKHLAETKPNPAKYESMRFSEIMYRLCDSVGWNAYRLDLTPQAADIKVPVFWTDGEQTLWEILAELATASQSIIYFDEYGYMNVRTREDAFNPNNAPVWTLRSETTGTQLADIETLEDAGGLGSNLVKVVYAETKWAGINNGFALNTTVWEGSDPTVLRSSPLSRTLEVGVRDPDGRERFQMSPKDAATWPHQGQVLIEGEVIEYDAKMFVYQDGGRFNYAWVTSQAEHDMLHNKVQSSLQYRNYYDGQFRIKERGQWNSAVVRHSVDAANYTVTQHHHGANKNGGGFFHDRRESTVSIRTAGLVQHWDEFITVTRGVPGDSPWRYIGTKLRINNGNSIHAAGGIVFNMTNGSDGYYVEVCPTSQINDKDREVRHELVFYIIKNGTRSPYWPAKGKPAPVAMDAWGELDVWYSIFDQRVRIYYRGQEVFHHNIPDAWKISPSGKFGMFARGNSDVSFDYLYASSRHADPEPTDDYSSVNSLDGTITGRRFVREWVHRNTRKQRNKRKKTKKSIYDKRQRFMDDFGPYVHELKEYEAKFDSGPVISSSLYSTNEWASYMVDYQGMSWGARFTMVNTERYNAVLHGEDSLTNPFGKPIQQKLIVLGRGLVIGEGEEVVVRNEQQIRARGEIITEINSNWIQSKEAAEEIANWIVNHWSRGVDQVTVTIFGNPLFHVGDVVAVDYPDLDMSASTHHYFVTETATSFDGGLSTSLTLRRRN